MQQTRKINFFCEIGSGRQQLVQQLASCRRMQLFLLAMLLASQLVSCSETSSLHELVDVVVEQNAQLTAAAQELKTELSLLQQELDALVASTTAQHTEQAQRRLEFAEKLDVLLSGQRLPTGASSQRRSLSSDTCSDPAGPQLVVDGICSCTGGLLVEGRNITDELDELNLLLSADDDRLAEWNCTTLEEPVVVGRQTFGGPTVFTVALSPDGSYAYVGGDSFNGTYVVNVSDATSPTVMGSVQSRSAMYSVVSVAASSAGNLVYAVGRYSDSIAVVNVSNPSSPAVVGSVIGDSINMNYPFALAASPDDHYAYVAGGHSHNMAVVDVQDPDNPRVVGSLVGNSTNMYAPFALVASNDGNYVYVTGAWSGSLTVVDVNDPTFPSVSSIIRNNIFDGAHGLALSPDGKFAYVPGYLSGGLAVVNVQDPRHPTMEGNITGDTIMNIYCTHVAVSPDGNYAYVLCSGKIVVVNVSNASNPTVVASITASTPSGVAVSPDGNYVYVTERGGSIVVVQWQNCTAH